MAERLGMEVEGAPPAAAARRRATAARAPSAPGAARRSSRWSRRGPGLTVAQLAAELGVDRTALYRVIRRLEADGRMVKRGATIHPA